MSDDPSTPKTEGRLAAITQSWPKHRLELLAWLQRNDAESLAELYVAAVSQLDGRPPGYVRLVSHCVRELRNRLPDVIAGPLSVPRLDYASRLDRLAGIWDQAGAGPAAAAEA